MKQALILATGIQNQFAATEQLSPWSNQASKARSAGGGSRLRAGRDAPPATDCETVLLRPGVYRPSNARNSRNKVRKHTSASTRSLDDLVSPGTGSPKYACAKGPMPAQVVCRTPCIRLLIASVA
jgi:hypothetical protein